MSIIFSGTSVPFLVRFMTDNFEYSDGTANSEAAQMDRGFMLMYTMDATCNGP